MKTCVESLQKQIMGLFSIYKILSYWISHYRQRKSFRQTAKTGCAKSSFLAARNTCTRTTDYITFDFSFLFWFLLLLGNFECHCLWHGRYGFFSVLAAIPWKNSDKRPWIENGEDLAVHSSTWPVRKASDVQQLIGVIKHKWKNIVFFQECCYGFS